MKHKFNLGETVTFEYRDKIFTGKIREITLFRRDNTIGYGVSCRKAYQFLLYRTESEIRRVENIPAAG